jgi:small conductance mechanosensitive channel
MESSKMPKKRENTLIQIFTTSLKIAILIITGLMVLEEFSVEIGPILAACRNCGLWFWRSISYPRYYFWSFIILENQYRIGDVGI